MTARWVPRGPLRVVVVVVVVLAAATLAPVAMASDLIDRNATGVSLAINGKAEALLTYTAGGKVKRVLAWGAVNALAPSRGRQQVSFKLDYAGGYGKYRRAYWKTFDGRCGAYTGPALAWRVTACTAADGSHWALQAWQRKLPNYGLAPSPAQAVWELRLSHWTGDLPLLAIETNWAWRRWDHLFGTYTYAGSPVFGFRSTATGVPLDTFGRNIYLDTFESAYGSGWRRENSFLTHTGTGAFCYSVNPHGSRPSGMGKRYRATVQGPGVTPDVTWEGAAPGPYDQALDLEKNTLITELGDSQCRPN